MNRAAQIKKWAPGVAALIAGGMLLLGVFLTWKTLSESNSAAGGVNERNGEGIRISTDPAGLTMKEPDPTAGPQLPSMEQGKKTPGQFGLPQFPDAFDFHSMEAKTAAGKSPIGSSAFLSRKARAAEIAQFYLLELGKGGWELVWQRDTKIHPNNDPGQTPITGTRLRWLDRKHQKQLTLLALDDPKAKHTAQAVVSWATLPGGSGG